MLKLQRNAYHREIAIRLRDSDPIFTKNLLLGIAVAIFLHLVPFLTVKIGGIAYKAPINRDPIVVEADMGLSAKGQGVIITLQIDEHGLLPRYVLEPESAIPGLPDMPLAFVQHRLDNIRGKNAFREAFTQVEVISYLSPMKKLSYKKVEHPIRIRVSGALGVRSPDVRGLQKLAEVIAEATFDGEYRVTMDVRVDDRTGRVFWFAIKNSSNHEVLDSLAANMVRELSFNKEKDAFVTEGEVEVLFTR